MAEQPAKQPTYLLGEPETQTLWMKIFMLLFAVWLGFGLLVGEPGTLLTELKTIVLSQCPLITDYIALAGIGGAFVNSALVLLFNIILLKIFRPVVTGALVGGMYISAGFALFGKNIVNILPIYLGVYLYARIIAKKSYANYLPAAFFSTSLCPLVSEIPFMLGQYPRMVGILAAVVVGVYIGFIMPALARWTAHTHQAYNLYNYGFATGLASTVIVSVFNSFGYRVESVLVWNTAYRTELLVLLLGIFVAHIFFGMALEKRGVATKLIAITKSAGRAEDYIKKMGLSATLVNMGLVGLLGTLVIYFSGGDFSGPTVGCILTIAGFGANGLNVRNVGYVMIGVILASALHIWSITAPAMQLCVLLCSGLAPIAGDFGIFAGILAGFLHSSVARNVGGLSSPLNLYNNGFAIGVLAIFLVPVIKELQKKPLHIPDKDEVPGAQ